MARKRKLQSIRLHPGSRPCLVDVLFVALLALTFLSIPVVASPDSSEYVSNAHRIFGTMPFSGWVVYRGPVFSLILRVSFFLFGESAYGTLLMFAVLYFVMVFASLYIFRLMGWAGGSRLWIWVVGSILIFLNPSVLAYAHFILTEFPALVFSALAFCLILKTHILLKRELPQKQRIFVLLARYAGTILFTILLYGIKQMFFPLAVIPFLLSEIILLFHSHSIKKTVISLVAAACIALSVFLWSAVWASVIRSGAGQELNQYNAGNLVGSTLIDGQRYFRVAQQDRGVSGVPVQIEVMDDSYTNVIKTFNYTFSGTVGDSFGYLFACLRNNPGRFFKSYIDNFRVICNLEKVVDVDLDGYLAYDPVAPRQSSYIKSLFFSHENGYWLDRFRHTNLVRGSTAYEDSHHFPPPNSSYIQGVDNNLFTNTLFDTPYPHFSYFLFSFPASISPFLFLLSICMCILHRIRKKSVSAQWLWERILLVSGTIFLFILFLAMTASSMDRYAFPLSVLSVLLLLLMGEGVMGYLRRFLADWKNKKTSEAV